MKIKKIQLNGFKSFPDQTGIEVQGRMTGIVGPNGCGKSNIVDAVRWVMGESSRHIRASSLEDVIFSGTNTRKPLGQASVELLFDNSDGKIGGPYAQYQELSLRRIVSRDRESKYYLNGSRCRRKDITDIFFGTGLGGNSYAIIEQGMIARIVEAKPEEMRAYIEEAAGVSKYKERRRDTENRMRRTQDNLDRVADVREELEKQMRKLKRQAGEARRYKKLRQEKDCVEAELLLLNLRTHEAEERRCEKVLSGLRVDIEQAQATLHAAETELEHHRTELDEVNDELNLAKENAYRLDAKLAGLEREISDRETRISQLEQEKHETIALLDEAGKEIKTEESKRDDFARRGQEIKAHKEELTTQFAECRRQTETIEKETNKLQSLRDQHHSETRESSETLKVERTRAEFYEKALAELDQSRREITAQQEAIDLASIESERAENRSRLEQCRKEIERGEQTVTQAGEAVRSLRNEIHKLGEKLNEEQALIQEMQGRLSSLKVLQDADLGHDVESFGAWLEQSGLSQPELVAENVTVAEGWENAAEIVLGTFLEAVKVASIDEHADRIEQFKQGTLVLLESDEAGADSNRPTLADKLTGSAGLHKLLSQVLLVDNLAQALSQRSALEHGQSLITPDGIWVGKNWLKLHHYGSGAEGVLIRKHKIESLRAQIDEAVQSTQAVRQAMEQARANLLQQEDLRDKEQERQTIRSQETAALESNLKHYEQQIARHKARMAELDQMQQDVQMRRQQLVDEHQQSKQEQDKALEAVKELGERHGDLEKNLARLKAVFSEKKRETARLQEAIHKAEVEEESVRVGRESSIKQIDHLKRREQELKQRATSSDTSLNELKAPLTENKNHHEKLISERFTAKQKHERVSSRIASMQKTFGELDDKRNNAQERLDSLRETHETAHADVQVSVARGNDVREALAKLDREPKAIEAELDEQAKVETHEEKLQEIRKKIERLGSINLVAIEEFNEISSRKEFIDAQHTDLVSALETLRSAIKKIDRETRGRFKQTFDMINENLKSIFPTLFGGGEAYLEMTEQDLLTTGITVMVKPPGKRLSSIHLMSGGEKALAAAAVVFAIFELKPAPFCILDEVDAPLDERNIERFCEMIRGMSERVQYIMITHNKISMEYMDRLIGITMQELGVSRPVSVDMEEAVKMASA